MTAMVRPVGIQYTNLCHGRVSVFFPCKIILNMQEIFKGHSQIQRIIQCLQRSLIHLCKSVKYQYICRLLKLCDQSVRNGVGCFSGVYRIDAVLLHYGNLCLCQLSGNHISGSRTNDGIFLLIQQLHALLCGICSLVKLTRQVFYRKYNIIWFAWQLPFI